MQSAASFSDWWDWSVTLFRFFCSLELPLSSQTKEIREHTEKWQDLSCCFLLPAFFYNLLQKALYMSVISWLITVFPQNIKQAAAFWEEL